MSFAWMQQFETFVHVCAFFIRSKLDPQYVNRIDEQLERPTDKDIVLLVKHVKDFHSMRKHICGQIFKYIDKHSVFNTLIRGRGCVQYKSAPDKSVCAISNVSLTPNTGLLIVVDACRLITIHTRYKILLYHFWTIVHMPDEIGLEAIKWLQTQNWWNLGLENDIEICTQKILNYNNQHFAKTMYVKLKTIAEYVEKELNTLPKKV